MRSPVLRHFRHDILPALAVAADVRKGQTRWRSTFVLPSDDNPKPNRPIRQGEWVVLSEMGAKADNLREGLHLNR
jgi:hypothetical protein